MINRITIILLSLFMLSATDSVKVVNTKKVKNITDSIKCSFGGNAGYFKIIRDMKKDSIK